MAWYLSCWPCRRSALQAGLRLRVPEGEGSEAEADEWAALICFLLSGVPQPSAHLAADGSLELATLISRP